MPLCRLRPALSAVVLFQLAVPGCPMVSGVGSAVADMRSGLCLAGAPEDALINAICIEMSRFYGMLTQGSGVEDAVARGEEHIATNESLLFPRMWRSTATS